MNRDERTDCLPTSPLFYAIEAAMHSLIKGIEFEGFNEFVDETADAIISITIAYTKGLASAYKQVRVPIVSSQPIMLTRKEASAELNRLLSLLDQGHRSKPYPNE